MSRQVANLKGQCRENWKIICFESQIGNQSWQRVEGPSVLNPIILAMEFGIHCVVTDSDS